MKVSELIEKLKTFPQDAIVVYQLYSDITEMHIDEPVYITADDKEVVYRNGMVMTFNHLTWPYKSDKSTGEEPNFISVVRFPGN